MRRPDAMQRHSSPRLTSFDYVGVHRYSLTCCTFQRLPIFTSHESVSAVLDAVRLAAEREVFSVVAYCFMPYHLHLVVAGDCATSNLRTFVEQTKQRSGFWYRQRAKGPLWQRSYWDRVLRHDEATNAAVRYVLANPVRAGMVARWTDYPFSGSCVQDREGLSSVWEEDVQRRRT